MFSPIITFTLLASIYAQNILDTTWESTIDVKIKTENNATITQATGSVLRLVIMDAMVTEFSNNPDMEVSEVLFVSSSEEESRRRLSTLGLYSKLQFKTFGRCRGSSSSRKFTGGSENQQVAHS